MKVHTPYERQEEQKTPTLKHAAATGVRPAIQEKERGRESISAGREGIESIIVAIILAFLFRTFEAEAFVIPTGSMAPTLQGRHKDVRCPECDHRYQTGANLVHEMNGPITEIRCPLCGFPQTLDAFQRNHDSFSGDRILVNKFAYQFGEPERWDVIVFKFPGNAKQNYIKRLVGLPNETIRIQNGDVYIRPAGGNQFDIARKPLKKMDALLQVVHDSERIPESLIEAKWPAFWKQRSSDPHWEIQDGGRQYDLTQHDSEDWLRYRHLLPTAADWTYIARGNRPSDINQRKGVLISDYYAYNDHNKAIRNAEVGEHWVGDLAMDGTIQVQSDTGTLMLDLVESGTHYRCDIDVATGDARLFIDGEGNFEDCPNGAVLTAKTPIRGKGRHRVRFSNIDDQILLRVGRRAIQWQHDGKDHPAHYRPPAENRPQWSPQDPGDAAPLAIGGKEIALRVSKLKVLRDIYYVSARSTDAQGRELSRELKKNTDYLVRGGFRRQTQRVFSDPTAWATTKLFDARQPEEFTLEEDQFFPMGDNNPHSRDARLWAGDLKSKFDGRPVKVGHYVDREMLIGKAFLIYWPHGWNVANIRLPIIPNIDRMGLIK